jgi:hypothetical protein
MENKDCELRELERASVDQRSQGVALDDVVAADQGERYDGGHAALGECDAGGQHGGNGRAEVRDQSIGATNSPTERRIDAAPDALDGRPARLGNQGCALASPQGPSGSMRRVRKAMADPLGQEDVPQRYGEREQPPSPAKSVRIRNSTTRSGMATSPAGASTGRRKITVTEG